METCEFICIESKHSQLGKIMKIWNLAGQLIAPHQALCQKRKIMKIRDRS